ncbi:27736_t:CDS:2 [Gigaspora margarita]|uniref:Ubiquitin carboxyl-terminal hydrolase n=1 Tax=Gigaspora margarita TaxID=4874 RepID=A0ABM8W2E0_GIGMA|nr:27736_t:CDS:2 [Gigaspora margarita]
MSTSSDQDNPDNPENAPAPLSIAERIKILQDNGLSENLNNVNNKISKINTATVPFSQASTTQNLGMSTTHNLEMPTIQNLGMPTIQNIQNLGISTTQNVGMSTTQNVGMSTTQNVGMSITQNLGMSTTQNLGMPTLPTSNFASTNQTSLSNTLIASNNSNPLITSAQNNSSLLENLPISDRIDVSMLHDLLNVTNNPPNILVLDIRLRSVFEMGHIKTKNIVCLEPFLLEDGISSVTLESNLKTCPEHEQKLFAERQNFDLVVYYGHDSEIMSKNSSTNLVQAIFENEFQKPLKRYPVFLVGGFVAWEQLTGEGGIERNIYNNITQINRNVIYNNVEMHNTNYDSTQNGYGQEISGIKPSRPLTRNRDRVKRNGKVLNMNPNRASIILNTLDFYQQPGDSSTQFTEEPNPLDNTLFNDLTNNMSSKPKVIAPNKPLPRPIPNVSNNSNNSSINQSGSRLQRRKTIFDHPYHGFSEVKNPDYDTVKRPPPPRKPLPQIPPVQQTLPSIIPNNNPVQMKVKRPEYSHTSESSFSQMGSGIGTTGLRNLGNTCFMNSILQCLSGTLPFARYFLDGSFKRHINRDNPLGTKGELADKFATLIRVMWSDQYVSVSPVTFKEAIGCFAPQFSGSEQQDSQEFLAYLLDGLHEDLNLNYHNTEINDLTQDYDDIDNLPLNIASELAWEKHLMRNSSIVVSLFQGQFCNRLMCMTCGKTSTSFDVFMYLSLPIPTNIKNFKRVDLEMCLKSFIKEEILDGNDAWNCPRCNCPRRTTKQLSISRLPDILLIHLKRFSFYGPFRDKLETTVHFPIRRLDLTPYVPSNSSDGGSRPNSQQMGPFVYDLYAISNHYGGLNGGHYTACVRNGYRNEWHNFDDSRASICDERDIVLWCVDNTVVTDR